MDHIPGDSPVHVNDADRHGSRLLMQCADKLLGCGDEPGFEPQTGQSTSNAGPEKQIPIQDNGQSRPRTRSFGHGELTSVAWSSSPIDSLNLGATASRVLCYDRSRSTRMAAKSHRVTASTMRRTGEYPVAKTKGANASGRRL